MERFDVSYDAICSLCRLFEKEVELFRMISKLIKKVTTGYQKKGGEVQTLQISDVFQALDSLNTGKLSRKRLRCIVMNYAGSGGCELLDSDLNAVIRRLDHDHD